MVRTNVLDIRRGGLVVTAEVRAAKLDEREVSSRPDVVLRDERTGARVHREQYDKATGRSLPKGHGYRLVDDSGDPVPAECVRYYEVVDDREYEVERHEPTLGRGRTLSPTTWVWLDDLDEFLISRTYELWAASRADTEGLYDLAEYIRDSGEAPVLPVVLRRSLVEDWGIVTPQFNEDTFSLLVRVTRSRVAPNHHMVVPEERRPGGHVRRRFRQNSPFE